MTPELFELFRVVLLVLVAGTVVGQVLARLAKSESLRATVQNANQRIRAWWVMVALIAVALMLGKTGVIILFALVSFTGLREFATLTETRRGDHERKRRNPRQAPDGVEAAAEPLAEGGERQGGQRGREPTGA